MSVTSPNVLPERPRLRENVWYIDPAKQDALLVTSAGRFAVPVSEAFDFLALRTHVTGHLSIDEISSRSGRTQEEIRSVLLGIGEVGALYPAERTAPTLAEARARLLGACAIWCEELRCTNVQNGFAQGTLSRVTLLGWCIERYHLSRRLTNLVASTVSRCAPELGRVLAAWVEERQGDAASFEQVIGHLGVTEAELAASVPFITTRAMLGMLGQLLAREPFTVLLFDGVESALTPSEEQMDALAASRAGIELALLSPWFARARRRAAEPEPWAMRHQELFGVTDLDTLDFICTELHELRHAFDLLALEVRDYYEPLNGKYLPRQPVDFTSL